LLFSSSTSFSSSIYLGRSPARGVPADVFSKQLQITNMGTSYLFISDLYFFPMGWQFPGRNTNSTSSPLPMRIVNTGVATTNGSANPYQDVWDFL